MLKLFTILIIIIYISINFRVYNFSNFIINEFMKIEEFNDIINEKYKQNQNNFCKNINEYHNNEFENKIILGKAIYENISFNMFIYKKNDIVSDSIYNQNKWEASCTSNIIDGLNYYSKIKNLINKDIYILDIGGNIGWYTFLLGKYGYNIITFEPSKINYYILNKNYCLNNEINVTLINKGLFRKEAKCYIYSSGDNIGNGMIKCKENTVENNINNGGIILTKLSNYIHFFENKNLAMIKVDIEGSEGKAIESGIKLITKYHVPFIFLEFTPELLKVYGTNPEKFLKIFIRNGYKINVLNFFEKRIYDMEDLLKETKNLYIVYTPFLENKDY